MFYANENYKSSVYVKIQENVWKKWKYIQNLALKSMPAAKNSGSMRSNRVYTE